MSYRCGESPILLDTYTLSPAFSSMTPSAGTLPPVPHLQASQKTHRSMLKGKSVRDILGGKVGDVSIVLELSSIANWRGLDKVVLVDLPRWVRLAVYLDVLEESMGINKTRSREKKSKDGNRHDEEVASC